MSYDVSLIINTGIKNKEVVYIGNYTYNVSGMFKKALGHFLTYFNKKKAKDCIHYFQGAIRNMKDYLDKYKK